MFAAAGRALYHAHRFEHNLKGLASLVHQIHHARSPEPPVSFSQVSIGPLLDAARRLSAHVPAVEALFEEARDRRNALCHSLLHDRREDLATPEGRQALEGTLRSDALVLSQAADHATTLLRELVEGLEKALDGTG